jgi:hypothetical protein
VVENHAPIVNISLGAPDSAGEDPVEQAVNQLSAQYGTLFVVAAGNNSLDESVTTPASADAALAVGAVDHDDALAFFTSRGPRIGDHAIKPDLTAPGVDIVAARASTAAPDLGEPVGTSYVRLSGTSMAAPHVAGAAALLLQQHRDWAGGQLKAALIGSALPDPTLSVFEQGAGRVDVDRATRQDVFADPASHSLGIAAFPHGDDPVVVREVTYHNHGAAAVTLALDGGFALHPIFALPDPQPAPPGMFTIGASEVTVPAGGSATVAVTVDTRLETTDGNYGGELVATAGDVRIVTPLAVDREPESYNLRLQAVDRTGAPATASTFLWPAGLDSLIVFDAALHFFDQDDVTVRLPRGRYRFFSLLDRDVSALAYPQLVLTQDMTVVLDARLTRPVELGVAGVALAPGTIDTRFEDVGVHFGVHVDNRPQIFTAQLGPDAPLDEVSSTTVTSAVPSGSGTSPSEVYNFARRERGRYFTGWQQTFAPGELATVIADHRGDPDTTYRKTASAVLDDAPLLGVQGNASTADYRGAFQRTEHYVGTGLLWVSRLAQLSPSASTVFKLDGTRSFRPGGRDVEHWNQAPFGPALALDDGNPPATRTGDVLDFRPSLVSDAFSPPRLATTAVDHETVTLLANGQVLRHFDTHPRFSRFELPPELATIRYETEITRSAPFALSTRVLAAWTFPSQHVDGPLPLILSLPTLRFAPSLDAENRARGRVTPLPIAIERPPGAAAPPITSLTVDVSFDDGVTWSPVPVLRLGDRAIGLVITPAGTRFVSLRGSARDAADQQVEQTIIRAYAVRAHG